MLRTPCYLMAALMLVCLSSGPSLAAEPSAAGTRNDDELSKLQGRWERQLSAEEMNSGLDRVVKEVKGNKETVTYYGEDEKVLRRHTVEFTLSRSGDLHVFTFTNMEVTDGPAKGTKMKEPYSYVYRVDDKHFFEVYGLLPGQEREPVVARRWKRVK